MFLKLKKEIRILSTRAASKLLKASRTMLLTKKQERELFEKITLFFIFYKQGNARLFA